MALTDTRLRALKPGKGKTECLVADGNGLYIRVRATRDAFTRTWQFRRKKKGRPSITTELATKRQQSSPTVEKAAEQWLAERVDHTHRKADQVRGYVDRAIVPELGDMRVSDVEPADIARVIRAYRDRVAKMARGRTGGRPAARALIAAFKGLFGYCVANGWIGISPAAQLTAAMTGPPPQARERVLTDDEIRFVMTTDIRPAPVLRFLLATGLRLGEAYAGHRDGQYWVVPAKFSKNGREQLIHDGAEIVELPASRNALHARRIHDRRRSKGRT
jgi:integrase